MIPFKAVFTQIDKFIAVFTKHKSLLEGRFAIGFLLIPTNCAAPPFWVLTFWKVFPLQSRIIHWYWLRSTGRVKILSQFCANKDCTNSWMGFCQNRVWLVYLWPRSGYISWKIIILLITAISTNLKNYLFLQLSSLAVERIRWQKFFAKVESIHVLVLFRDEFRFVHIIAIVPFTFSSAMGGG